MPELSASGWTLEAIPVLSDNYVWTLSNGEQAIIVDPGVDAPVAIWLRQRDLQLAAILVTHHHHDHTGGLTGLRQEWPQAVSYGPHDERIAGIDQRVGDGDRIVPHPALLTFDTIEIPGHTATHIAFHGNGLLFCGDTLFSAGCGRLFEGTPQQMLTSLERLAALPGESLVCCGHEYTAANCRFALAVEPGNANLRCYRDEVADLRSHDKITLPSTIDRERAVNPFLRVDAPEVRETLARERRLPLSADRVDAFAALRAWKDGFHG